MDLSSAAECHSEMLEGFCDGDSKRTITALHRDLQGAGNIILSHLEK
jgi:hypothetical protein